MIFRKWGSIGNALTIGQVAINFRLLKSLLLQYMDPKSLGRVKIILNWALVPSVSKVIIKYERSKNTLSYSDILNIKNSDSIFIPLSINLTVWYGFHFNQDGLAKSGVLFIQRYIEDRKITTEGKKFVVQLLLIIQKTAKIITWSSPQDY